MDERCQGSRLTPSGSFQPRIASRHSCKEVSGTISCAEIRRSRFSKLYAQLLHLLFASTRADNLILLQFGHLKRMVVSPFLAIVPSDSFAQSVRDHAERSELIIVPWNISNSPSTSFSLPPSPEREELHPSPTSTSFGFGSSGLRSKASEIFGIGTAGRPFYSEFVRQLFSESDQDVSDLGETIQSA